ncbi:hypothetical protein FA014_02645 [Cellulomonas hominis]|uniref:Uncharacterized protein n=1 Tax=Cellulomonas hominis TaxID=156981 RepID=A0A7Z8K1F2_9CELL|nr:hypothetical protein [Cellulomonas hominis]TKR26988.1 hypothetical protein FA014_02645 [Cellulomonas hominis]
MLLDQPSVVGRLRRRSGLPGGVAGRVLDAPLLLGLGELLLLERLLGAGVLVAADGAGGGAGGAGDDGGAGSGSDQSGAAEAGHEQGHGGSSRKW